MSQSYAERVVEVLQRVIADPTNSSTTNLAVGNAYTFTGIAKSTLGVAGIQVSLFANQNCTVQVQQSPDGINWDISDSFVYYASASFGTTVQAVNSYFRVVVTTANLTTTTFRLQSCLCPVVEAVPRALNEDGNFKTAIYSIADEYGFEVENTPMGEMRVVSPTRLVGAQFDGATFDTNFWVSTVANAASVTQGGSQIVMASGTNAAGSIKVNSVRRARYVSANANGYRSVVQLGDTGTANNTRRWGVAYGSSFPTTPTVTDGAYFELSGTTFSIVTMKGSAATTVSSGSFNGNLGKSFSPGTSATTYEIYWTNSKVWFVVGNELLHTVAATAAPWADTVAHYIYLENTNSGNTTNVTLSCRVASIRRLGNYITQPISKYQAGTTAALVLKYGAGNLHELVVSGVVNNAVITLYDNTTNSGTILFSTGSMTANTVPFAIDLKGAPFSIGLTLAITVANANATVVYE